MGRDSVDDHELGEELRTAALQTPAGDAHACDLEVIEGPDLGLRVRIEANQAAPLLVGTSPSCALRLNDNLVSRRHARLSLEGRMVRITDLGSTNGTFVDGVRLIDGFLCGGELVRLGRTALKSEVIAAPTHTPLPSADRFGHLIGSSVAVRRLYPLCQRLAASDVSVVIEGETGTGKEVLAESLHELGPRAQGPFVVFDCTAVAPSLLESALFGHEKGSFSGALATHRGVFEEASGGTLLIDEIGDLDLSLQPKLLGVLQRGEVRRVGGARPIAVDVRVLAATRRDLDHEVQAGRFRDDLFYRLAVARIELPPLREKIRRRGVARATLLGALRGGSAVPRGCAPAPRGLRLARQRQGAGELRCTTGRTRGSRRAGAGPALSDWGSRRDRRGARGEPAIPARARQGAGAVRRTIRVTAARDARRQRGGGRGGIGRRAPVLSNHQGARAALI